MNNLFNYKHVFHLLLVMITMGCAKQTSHKNDGDGSVTISGKLQQWHDVTLSLSGPFATEKDSIPNPFTDYRFTVTFQHESGTPKYEVPGYFAVDGQAASSGAESGNIWRAHVSPDKLGKWNYKISFSKGSGIATSEAIGETLLPYHDKSGSFQIGLTDKTGRDFRARGRLQYVGKHHLRFKGNGEYFLKAGPDSPETLLAYTDFDNTQAMKNDKVPLKTYTVHIKDWEPGDPIWKDNMGKGLIGALNYLSEKGVNSISFLPYNAGGDGDNVWPFISRNDKFHYDCSKLDQWGIVFAHAQKLGLHLHFKLQETENDDHRKRDGNNTVNYDHPIIPALDGGATGPERKLYLRELIARYGHHLALNWNLGEENTQTAEEQKAMAKYIKDTDPYNHHIVIHSYPNMQELVYEPLLGEKSVLTGASLQNMWNKTHARTVQWINASAKSGKPWVVANDEQGSAGTGIPPDPGYLDFNGIAPANKERGRIAYDLHDTRKLTLWGNIMAGGAGVEYYFGYKLPENDLIAEDFRSRDLSWDYCRIAINFFKDQNIPFWDMKNADHLVGNPNHDNTVYCLGKTNDIYLVYLPDGGQTSLDFSTVSGIYNISWFNPRNGELNAQEAIIIGSKAHTLIAPSKQEDWLAVIGSINTESSDP